MVAINTQRLIKSFVDMVSVSSESGNESAFARYMLELGKKLGLQGQKDKYENVYLFFKGQADSIMFNTHMDTVSPGQNIKAKISGKYITSDRKTVLGADSKAGIAAMFEVINLLKENNINHKSLLITLTRNEESGIPTADKILSDIKLCVVPDRGTPVGEIITEAPYAQIFEVTVKGKTAYAPTNHKDGKNAILAAINILDNLPWGDIDSKTTTNVGIINGGTMTSMVPDICVFKGSCYSFSKKSLDNFITKLSDSVLKADARYGTISQLKMLEYFGGYKINKKNALVKLVERSIRKSKTTPVYKIYKAVTNANLLNQVGIKTVLISTGVENQHTVNEKIKISELEKITSILLNILIDNVS